MGTYNKGILGAFSGKVGPVVGANWRGKDILRSLPKKSKRQPTETQLLQRLKFSTVAAFLTPLKPVISRYFGVNTGALSKMNHATSYHIKGALVPAGDTFVMDYSKVLIGKGDLVGFQSPVIAAQPGGILRFEWTDNSGRGNAAATDRVIVVAYQPDNHWYEFTLDAGSRDAAEAVFTLPAYMTGTEIQCWISLASETGKRYATSTYMGAVMVL